MNILVLHRIPYHYINYASTIDHDEHHVVYVGVDSALENIPLEINCSKVVRGTAQPVHKEVLTAIETLEITFDLIISLSEYELMEAAKVREALGVKGPSVDQVTLVRDKVAMKKAVIAHKLRVPTFSSLKEWLIDKADFDAEFEMILKPVDGASSENVVKFPNSLSLKHALDGRSTGVPQLDQDTPNYDGFEVEEFISGAVRHFDGIVRNGQVTLCVGSRYINTLYEFAAHGMPSASVQQDLTEHECDWVQRAVAAVQIEQGVFHLEAIETKEELVFLEIAHRAGGARIIPTFAKQTGVHLPSVELSLLLNPNYQPEITLDRENKYAWIIVPGHHYDKPYCRVSGYESLSSYDGLLALEVIAPDKPLPSNISYLENQIPLTAFIKASTTHQLEELIQTLFTNLTIELSDTPFNHL
ncbi:ATP-grasp domain-containing protein (plasmid) [Pseudoalteromonas xiamenensis]|uniref:ATP-grasp domain-containing protein n=1 Tax=Pseudoalteromonas xiamenensis TaxID=882626 RepID=UPI0027E3BCCB|nr:ATP-grasp domain-containing protein [Pseudoalteromonas xiamenensis]WMN61733.1 ATP-grasp domain-containing protein [Pseudoalteromonas xiamenensis]